MNRSNSSKSNLFVEVIVIIFALVCLSPFYFLIVNSLKPYKELALNTAALPKQLYFENYVNAFQILNFPKAFLNSFIITVATNAGLIIISSMAAYRLVRNNSQLYKFLFVLFISSMVIPFQSIMLPMVKVANKVGWINSYHGVMFVYFGFGVSFTIFLFHGFMKTIPLDIEEAAVVDGCTTLGVFWKIVFPLLKPISVTAIILNGLWIWNDFLLPLLIIPSEKLRTIPLAISSFFAQYAKQWDLAMAALIMSIAPVVILFILMQKYIIEGIVSGSVKG